MPQNTSQQIPGYQSMSCQQAMKPQNFQQMTQFHKIHKDMLQDIKSLHQMMKNMGCPVMAEMNYMTPGMNYMMPSMNYMMPEMNYMMPGMNQPGGHDAWEEQMMADGWGAMPAMSGMSDMMPASTGTNGVSGMPGMGSMPDMGAMPGMGGMPAMGTMPDMEYMPGMGGMPAITQGQQQMPAAQEYMLGSGKCSTGLNTKEYIYPCNLPEALMHIKDAVMGEKEDEMFYNQLLLIAPCEEDKKVIESIRDDEKKHGRMFREIYCELTGQMLPPAPEGEQEKLQNYCKAMEKAFLGELKALEKYRKILFAMNNPKHKNMVTEIASDELKHACKYNYLMSKNKCSK
ncbi:MAG: hypothetical protein Q7J78_07460 [Clostridiales bacterium]|nr:hypothetical protein [Clostridiales bacterium]